ncbi:MAG: outer membrane lipoprotein chaperone LolA [Betaproteobacteria bacterium]|nr:outer membrane lipoprotein chaperone LolA [Betaproteobacteria bacterium]
MRVLGLFLLLALGATGSQAASLERFKAFLRTTQSARAEFSQQVHDRQGRMVQESSGSFSYVRPGRFRWVYASPNPQLIVGDGARVWIYDEDLNQVTVSRMQRAIGSTPAALLAGSAEIEQTFVFSEAGMEGGLEWLEAKPRDREASFERIRLGMGPSGVEAMELLDHFGQTTRLRFSKLIRNPELDPGSFRFTPPKGADVLGEK